MTPARFREARHKLGLSVSQTAELLGVGPRTVQRWEADGDVQRGCGLLLAWLAWGERPSLPARRKHDPRPV